MGRIMKLLWFTTKAGVAAGSVYVTVDQGVWGTPEQTSALCQRLYEEIPGVKTFREQFVGDFIPKDMGNINYRDYWNSAVFKTFGFIADSPTKAMALKDYLVESASSLMTETSTQTEEKQS